MNLNKFSLIFLIVIILSTPIVLSQEIFIKDVADVFTQASYLQGCQKLANRNNITYFVYPQKVSETLYNVYILSYNHKTKSFSYPVYLGYEKKDHIYPCVVIDNLGYLHVTWGSRPYSLKYRKSTSKESIRSWGPIITTEDSATYPVTLVNGKDIYTLFRYGDSFLASLNLAVNRTYGKVNESGDINTYLFVEDITTISNKSIPIPSEAFINKNRNCFMFSLRDHVLGFPPFYDSKDLSTKESLSIICRDDNGRYSDLNNNTLKRPLNYSKNLYDFPRIIKETPIKINEYETEFSRDYSTKIIYDDSVIEFNVTKQDYNVSGFVVKEGNDKVIAAVIFTQDGKIGFTNHSQTKLINLRNYVLGKEYQIRLKFYPSKQVYRIWINGESSEPYPFYFRLYPNYNISIINNISTTKDIYDVKTMQDYSMVFSTLCYDKEGEINIIFDNKKYTSTKEYHSLMHYRKGVLREIGNPLYNKYHPSCISDDNYLYVVVEYFTDDRSGHYEEKSTNEGASEIYLLKTENFRKWEEQKITNAEYAQIHPGFKKKDNSGLFEFVWVDNQISPILKYAYFYSSTIKKRENTNEDSIIKYEESI